MRRKTYPAREVDNTLEWQQRRLCGIRAHRPNHADANLAFHRQLVKDLIGGAFLAVFFIALIFLLFSL